MYMGVCVSVSLKQTLFRFSEDFIEPFFSQSAHLFQYLFSFPSFIYSCGFVMTSNCTKILALFVSAFSN